MKIFAALLVLLLTACGTSDDRTAMRESLKASCAVELKVTLTLTQYGSDTVVYYCDKLKQ